MMDDDLFQLFVDEVDIENKKNHLVFVEIVSMNYLTVQMNDLNIDEP
jgi:hypothetical protein